MRILATTAMCAFVLAGCTVGPATNDSAQPAIPDTYPLNKITLAKVSLKSPEQLASETKSRAEKYGNSTVYWSPPISDNSPFVAGFSNVKLLRQLGRKGSLYLVYFLETWKYNDRRISKYRLTISVILPEFVHISYAKATDDNGLSLEVVQIYDGKAVCAQGMCSQFLGIDFEQSYLLDKRNTGFEVRLTSSDGAGTLNVRVPRSYVKGHLMAIGAL